MFRFKIRDYVINDNKDWKKISKRPTHFDVILKTNRIVIIGNMKPHDSLVVLPITSSLRAISIKVLGRKCTKGIEVVLISSRFQDFSIS